MRIEDVKRTATAVRLGVGTGEHPSQDKEFPPEQAAAVVGQRRHLPLGLEGIGKENKGGWGGGGRDGTEELNPDKRSPPPWSTSSSACPECGRR